MRSSDVPKITATTMKVAELASKGVVVTSNVISYSYTKLPELRVSLLSDAVADARARAEQIVKGSGEKVGALQSASSGVVQLLPENSLDVNDYGAYDTAGVRKDVMLTVKVTFSIK